MKKFALIAGLCLAIPGSNFAQSRAEMSAPVIRRVEENVVLRSRISYLSAGHEYRLGVGSPEGEAPDAEVELLLHDELLPNEAIRFQQVNTQSWLGVSQLDTVGVVIEGSTLPEDEEHLTLQISMPRELAQRYERLFVIVARDYGTDTWYLEDYVELNRSHW